MATGTAQEDPAPPPRDHRRGGVVDGPPGDARPGARRTDPLPQWTANLQIQRVLAMAMFGCVAWAFVRMLLSFGVDWPRALSSAVLATLVFVAGLSLGGRGEGRHYRRYTEYGLADWALLLVPIVLVLKLLPLLLADPGAVGQEIASWMDEPWRFWDVALVWSLLLVFFTWDFSHRLAEDLGKLSFQPGERAPAVDSPAYYDWLTSPYRFINHAASWRRLMWAFVGGGFVIMIFTGLALVSPAELGNPSRPEVAGAIPSVLLYFVLGLLFASQTSLDRLRTDWLRAGVQIQSGLARRWLGFGLVLMAVSLVLALLLPTTFSERTVDSLPGVWRVFWPVQFLLSWIAWLIAKLASLLLAPFLWLLPGHESGGTPVGPPQLVAPQLPPEEAPASAPGPMRLVWGLLFYVVPSLLAAYALWNTWQKRRELWRGISSASRDILALLWGGVLDLVAVLWRFFGSASPRILDLAPDQIRARWRRRRAALGGGGPIANWIRLRSLDPRALIQYFYLSLVQRAAAIGWERRRGQTPYEYSRELAGRLPDRRAELDTLTEAFVRAKYSARPVQADDARRIRGPWERLRGALQTRRRARQVSTWFGLHREDDPQAQP